MVKNDMQKITKKKENQFLGAAKAFEVLKNSFVTITKYTNNLVHFIRV